MPNQKIKKKPTKKKKSLYNFSDDSDEEFSSYIQEDKVLPSSNDNQLNKVDLSQNSISANHKKPEEANSSYTSFDSYVQVAEVSIQTSLNNSAVDTVGHIESDLTQNCVSANHNKPDEANSSYTSSDSYVQVAEVSIQTSLNNSAIDTVGRIESDLTQNWMTANELENVRKEVTDSPVSDSDSYVQVLDASIQTSLDNSVMFPDAVTTVESINGDLSQELIHENKFNTTKKEEANSPVTDSDSYVEVADVSMQTSLDNSVKFSDVVNTVEPSNSYLSHNFILEKKLNHIQKEVVSSPVIDSDSYVEVADVSMQTSLDNSVKFSDDGNAVEPANSYLSHNLIIENKFNNMKKEDADSPVTDSDSYVLVADVSMQTSLDSSVKTTNAVTKIEAFKDNLWGSDSFSLEEGADVSFQFNANCISNPDEDEIYSSKDSGNGTGNFKGIRTNKVLAYDTDEDKSCSVNSPKATSLIIAETDSENDELDEDEMSIHTSNRHNAKASSKEINNIVGKFETMSITRSKQDSSSSDDEFENFLSGIKKSMTVKDRNSQENSKPFLQDFIVNDSDIEYCSDEASDELFHIKVTNDLRKKETKCSYDFDASSSSDDGLSSDSWSSDDKNSTCTSNRDRNMDKVTDTVQGKPSCPKDFLQPQFTPRIPRSELLKEKALGHQTSLFKKETKLKDTYSDKDTDEDLLDDNKHFLQSLSSDYPDFKRHPKASRYWKCFKETKLELAQHLHTIFNEVIFEEKLPKDFKIEWNPRYTKTAGTFYYKGTPSNFITQVTLSVKVCDSPERVRDTLAHELCHAAVKLINGVNEGHGPVWKSWAAKFNRKYSFMPVIVRCHDYTIKTKYTYQCTKCHYRICRHSKSLDTDAKVCGHCRGKFEVFLTKDLNNSKASTATPRTPNKFALFVKECYSVKRKETGMKHGDLMKLLSKEFAEKNSLQDH